MVLTGPDGPNFFKLPVDPEKDSRDLFRTLAHHKFKETVFPYWEPQHEVLSLRYGLFALATLPSVFAAQVNTRILNLHQLPNARFLFRLPPVLGATTIDAATTFMTQSTLIESDIIAGI